MRTYNPGAHIANTGTGIGLTFFIGSSKSPCCGTLNNWKFFVTSIWDVTMHLWRPTSTSSYELIAQQTFTAAVGLNTPLSTGTVEVEIDDVIGWYTSGAELIPPSVAAGSSTQNQVLAAPVVGTEVPWAMTPDTANTYAAGAVVTASK
ncbi:hypothetical protein DPMN_022865 [Dreissena polymorpha]|uniref:Uncharacterized protein n=1 Tax=Dreissena polymorpha TaxID=45954 RepID=A0A9D4NPK2_DREPO|nr:hypothetical protein DPMN_022865 [Dreissena polymorpha]